MPRTAIFDSLATESEYLAEFFEQLTVAGAAGNRIKEIKSREVFSFSPNLQPWSSRSVAPRRPGRLVQVMWTITTTDEFGYLRPAIRPQGGRCGHFAVTEAG